MNFSYDHLNRLVSFGNSQLTYDHEGKGNIVANSSIGQFAYGTNKPYQLIGAVDQGNQIPLKDQDIVYNTMLRPVSITQHEYNALFTYDSAGDRVHMQLNEDDTGILSRYYIDNTYEIESGVGTNKEFLYLDGDAYSASSVYVKENGSWNLYYIFRDYLGSITHLTDAGGVVVEENSYDAWGRLRDPQTQVLFNDDNQPALFLRRGYTSHEHLPWFGLTNMNARLYDPVLGRFLSPDPYVQMPDFSQNFNRYAYALNNPLKYIDQSGESFLGAVILGAIIGGIINLNVNAANVTSYGDMFAYFGMGALAGGLGAAAGAGVAGLVGTNSFIGGALTGISGGFAGGFAGGAGNAWMHGADFGEGLNAGLKQGGIGAAAGAVLGGVTGGIRAKSAGGNFWTGKGATHDFFASNYVEKNPSRGPALEYNNETANDFLHGNFGNPKNLNQLHADGTLPSSEYSMRGGRVWKNGVKETLGTTVKVGLTKSDVCLYPRAFEYAEKLYVVMGHELVHVNVNAAASFIGNDRSEATARAWSQIQEGIFSIDLGSAQWLKKYSYLVPDWKLVRSVRFTHGSVFVK